MGSRRDSVSRVASSEGSSAGSRSGSACRPRGSGSGSRSAVTAPRAGSSSSSSSSCGRRAARPGSGAGSSCGVVTAGAGAGAAGGVRRCSSSAPRRATSASSSRWLRSSSSCGQVASRGDGVAVGAGGVVVGGCRFRRGQGRCLVGGVEHFQADTAPHVTIRSGQMFLGDAEASVAMRALGDERIGHGEATAREFKRASVPEGPGERSASARPPGERLGGGTTA
ncbi:hypothetical protein Q3H58_003778 [Pseudomonas psychrotolerans]|nr:hypothetical protein [Pseudomonas psychrotolerans]